MRLLLYTRIFFVHFMEHGWNLRTYVFIVFFSGMSLNYESHFEWSHNSDESVIWGIYFLFISFSVLFNSWVFTKDSSYAVQIVHHLCTNTSRACDMKTVSLTRNCHDNWSTLLARLVCVCGFSIFDPDSQVNHEQLCLQLCEAQITHPSSSCLWLTWSVSYSTFIHRFCTTPL